MLVNSDSVSRVTIGLLPRCTSCSQHQSQSDTAHSWSSANQEAEAETASCGQRGRHGDSHKICKRSQKIGICGLICVRQLIIYLFLLIYLNPCVVCVVNQPVCVCVSLKVASKLLHATSGPMKTVEGSLHQWSHDAAHVHLVSTAVPLAIVLHPQPGHKERERDRKK